MKDKFSLAKTWIVLSICFFVLIASAYNFLQSRDNPSADEHKAIFTNVGFDTSITFQAYCSQSDFDKYSVLVEKTYRYYNELFDAYNEYEGINNVFTINTNGYEQPIKIDSELYDLIEFSLTFQTQNDYFDISQGSLLKLWHDYREEGLKLNEEGKNGKLPSQQEIDNALSHGGSNKIILKNETIQFTDPNTSIDLGGIAKGYTTQKVKEKLEEEGCTQGFINAGGNVVLIGEKENSWKIGIQSPDANSSLLTIELDQPVSIVTSGDYQRQYTVNETRYAHIIDPITGYPPTYNRSVTIICQDSTLADALSTALFCMDVQDGKNFLQEHYPEVGCIWIQTNQGQNCNLSNEDYAITVTDNMISQVSFS